MSGIKNTIARKAVKATAKHSARGAAAKAKRHPLRAVTLLALGALAGFMAGRKASSASAGP